MKAIFKREFQSFFRTMTGPVFMAALLGFVGVFFVLYNLVQGYPYFSAVLANITIVFLLIVPILTMRSFAEERRSKTDQLLLTSPVSVTDIVLGKYLSMIALLGVCCVIMLFAPFVMKIYGGGSLAADLIAIVEFFLLGSAYIALGMFISTLTESQVISAVGTFCVLLLLQLCSGVTSIIPNAAIANVIASLSLVGRFNDIMNQTLNLSVIVYYLTFCELFVFLSVQSVQKRRWR